MPATILGEHAITLATGTTAQRPTSAEAGMIRYNTTINTLETYNGTEWLSVGDQTPSYNIEYLIVAGGGGGGVAEGGGGGAGGMFTSSTFAIESSTQYTVTVGAGGAPATFNNRRGVNGNDSVFGPQVAIGGGGGGSRSDAAGGYRGANGGSGGGSTLWVSNPANRGLGTPGQGNNGGINQIGWQNTGGGGGGGGAGAQGGDAPIGSVGGVGGAGLASSISGSSVTYAGGGGSGGSGGGGVGGSGGGGSGGANTSQGSNGTTNRGGGAGGGGRNSASGTEYMGGGGGSGIVIVRYLGSQRGTGGTVTSSGGYTIHTFTSSGIYLA